MFTRAPEEFRNAFRVAAKSADTRDLVTVSGVVSRVTEFPKAPVTVLKEVWDSKEMSSEAARTAARKWAIDQGADAKGVGSREVNAKLVAYLEEGSALWIKGDHAYPNTPVGNFKREMVASVNAATSNWQTWNDGRMSEPVFSEPGLLALEHGFRGLSTEERAEIKSFASNASGSQRGEYAKDFSRAWDTLINRLTGVQGARIYTR